MSEDIDYDTACTPARDMLAALKMMGLLERLPSEQEWKDEEERAGGPEVMRLRAAHMLAGFAEAQVFLSRNAAADAGAPTDRQVLATELMFTGSPFPEEEGGEVAMLYAMAARLEDTLTVLSADALRDDPPRSVPRLVLPAMQAAGLVAELLSVAGEDEITDAEVKRLREAQEGLRKTASLLGDFIRTHKKIAATQ